MLRLFVVLLSVVFVGCFETNNVTKEDVSDMADCYETTIAVDDRYAIVLNKDCMDSLLLSAAPKIALETEAIVNAEEVTETAAEATETEEELDDVMVDSTPVALPVDADWELIATLQRNPLAPETFYIFPEENEVISKAYEAGKHFIFELGIEYKEGYVYKIRHYIIQPEISLSR